MGTITLEASARYGYGGKQYVARITGRHPKFTFEREFIGRKEGKRREYTSVVVDDPGLYEARDIDSKGRATDTYRLAWEYKDTLYATSISRESAMALAKRLPDVDWTTEGLRATIAIHTERLSNDVGRPDDSPILLRAKLWNLEPGEHPKAVVLEARKALIAARERELAERTAKGA